ncbi:MAG: hemerythrin family protein [Burkholderiaceae bacterium]|nr:hemerythrin family protein [Burkholderiaceae bacterium]
MTPAVVPGFRHDSLLIGFKPIDDLHREFQDILDALLDPAEADLGTHLLALHKHLLRHCAIEEEFMRQEAYPHLDRHRRAHERLLEWVADVRRRFDAGDVDGTRRFCDDLLGWFVVHAQTEDAELAAFLKGSPV